MASHTFDVLLNVLLNVLYLPAAEAVCGSVTGSDVDQYASGSGRLVTTGTGMTRMLSGPEDLSSLFEGRARPGVLLTDEAVQPCQDETLPASATSMAESDLRSVQDLPAKEGVRDSGFMYRLEAKALSRTPWRSISLQVHRAYVSVHIALAGA